MKLKSNLFNKSVGIKGKLIFIITGFSLFIAITISAISFFLSKSALEEQAFNQLKAIRETKKKSIQDYLEQIENQVKTLSEDLSVVEATKVFSTEFEYLGLPQKNLKYCYSIKYKGFNLV